MELDFIKEEILSIEDFDNVDESLMKEINANKEYRELFEELKEISALCKDIPSPEKDGVSLHDATLERIESGDTAPRYISSGRKYPLATAACLVVCCIAVLAARVLVDRKGNFDAAENENGIMLLADYEYSAEKAEADSTAESVTNGADNKTVFGASKHKAPSDSTADEDSGSDTTDDTGRVMLGKAPAAGGGAASGGSAPGSTAEPEEQESSAAEPESAAQKQGSTAAETEGAGAEDAAEAQTESMDAVINDVMTDLADTAVGGSYNGYFFEMKYDHSVCNVVFKENTFASDCSHVIDEIYLPLERKHAEAGTQSRLLPVLYYVVRELSPTREEINAYFEATGQENVKSEILDGLMSEDEMEAMQLLKSPYAFYHDGNVYTAEQIYLMYLDGTLGFDIGADTYDDEWELCYRAQTDGDWTSVVWDSDFPGFIEEYYRKSLGN